MTPPGFRVSSRAGALLLALGLGAFVVLELLAARAYPGGTYCEPGATSYRFWGNYLCDLTQPLTPRGEDNARAARIARAAFAAIAAAFVPFWWLLARLAGERRPRAIRALGLTSALGTNALAWLPSRHWPALHMVSVYLAALPGILAALLAVTGLVFSARRPIPPPSAGTASGARRAIAVLGAASLTLGLVDALGYAHAVATRAGCVPWLPGLQKLTALLVVAWMLAVALLSAFGNAGGRTDSGVE